MKRNKSGTVRFHVWYTRIGSNFNIIKCLLCVDFLDGQKVIYTESTDELGQYFIEYICYLLVTGVFGVRGSGVKYFDILSRDLDAERYFRDFLT